MECRIEQENREFLRAGTIAAAFYNVHRDPNKHTKSLTANDFFSLPEPPKRKPTKAELVANAEKVFSFVNAQAAAGMKRRKRRRKAG